MNLNRDAKLDTLKALSICFVIIWHIHPVEFINLGNNSLYIFFHRAFWVFLGEITLVAVPTFFLVSLFIFFEKQKENVLYFKKRMLRLIELYLFWTFIQIVIYYLINKEFPILNQNLIREGGPALPIVGGSVFFYIFNLILLSIFSYLFLRCNQRLKKIILIIIFISSFIFFEAEAISFSKQIVDVYQSPLNFVYLVPLSYALSKNINWFFNNKYKFLIAYVIFAIHDFVILEYFDYQLPMYNRISIAFGVLAFFCFIMDSRIKNTRIIFLLSKYSLGIFALHKYFQLLTYYLTKYYGYMSFVGVGIDIRTFIIFSASSSLTLLSLYFMNKVYLKRFIT